MKFWDVAKYSFAHLKHRGLRTWLTLLGIVVGIAAVILLVGLAQGLQASVTDELAMFGSDLMVVLPMNMGGGLTSAPAAFRPTSGKLFEKDVDIIRKIDGVEEVSKILMTSGDIKYKNEQITSSLYGMDTETYKETMVIDELEEGRLLEPGDRKVTLIGYGIAYDTFDTDVGVNSILEIAGENYRVVGVLEESGSSYSNLDDWIMISYEDAERIAGDTIADKEVSAIRLKVSPGYDPLEVEENIIWTLSRQRGVPEDEKDFSVVSARFIQEQVDSILGALTLFLLIVSGVALLVGAIGISNTMFMSVLERTREIGVLKSIGASSKQIQDLFLMESAMIGLAGGVVGLAIGFIFLQIINFLGFSAVLSVEMALFAFAFSVGIGIVAGTFPAKRASKVPAIEALRYE